MVNIHLNIAGARKPFSTGGQGQKSNFIV